MRRRFATLDVFTDRRFAGNPLAVVLDADGLDTAGMQAIAREFSHPETVFVFAPEQPRSPRRGCGSSRRRASCRLPGIRRSGPRCCSACRMRRRPAPRSCWRRRSGRCAAARCAEAASAATPALRCRNCPRRPGTAASDVAIAAALGLAPDDIGFASFRPGALVGRQPLHLRAGVAALAAIARCRPDLARFDAAFGERRHGLRVLRRDGRRPAMHFHARMFAPSAGVPEDPATGSAAAAFAGVLARASALPDGEHAIAIEQGYEMGRPSLIGLAFVTRGRQTSFRPRSAAMPSSSRKARSRHERPPHANRPLMSDLRIAQVERLELAYRAARLAVCR